jgi:hypothetical protein
VTYRPYPNADRALRQLDRGRARPKPKVWKVGEPIYGWQLMGLEEPPPATPAQRKLSARIAGNFAREAENLRAGHEALLAEGL